MRSQVLTIAGSDSGGGAGIQADLKTITVLGAYGLSVITALTAQNTRGVLAVESVGSGFVEQQLEAVFSDFRIDAVKIGMLHRPQIVRAVARALRRYTPSRVVLDPVMVATSGDRLIDAETEAIMREELFPLVHLITPNCREASLLSGVAVANAGDFPSAAAELHDRGAAAVLVKGGDLAGDRAADYLSVPGREEWFDLPRVDTRNSHGTGCTLSSAIAVYLAEGRDLFCAVESAKNYLTGALEAARVWSPGEGRGPVDHAYMLTKEGRR